MFETCNSVSENVLMDDGIAMDIFELFSIVL